MKAPSPAFRRGCWLGWGLSGIDESGIDEEGWCSSSFLQGHPPSLRFGHPDVTSDDTAPPRTLGYRRWRAVFSGCALRVSHGRSPQRSTERVERPGDGCPCVGAEETYGVPPQTLWCRMRTNTAPPPLLNETIRPPGSEPDQYAKPSPPGTDQPTHQPAHQHPGPAE